MKLSDWNCVLNATYKVNVVKCATESCPLECESIQYDLTVSSLITPTINDYVVSSSKSSLVSYSLNGARKVLNFTFIILN